MRHHPPLWVALLPILACGDPLSTQHAEPAQAEGDRPDVVLFVVDTLRADRLEPYGCERPTSPTIDALARSGVVFEDVTAQGSWTKPSMVSMLQGRYLTSYRDIPLNDSPTLGEAFQDAGYRTLAIVGNSLLSKRDGFHRGFDCYDVADREVDDDLERPGRRIDEIAANLLPQVFEAEGDGTRPPVFLWFHLMEPHAPYRSYPDLEDELPADAALLGDRRETFRRLTGSDARTQTWMRIAESLAAYDQEVRMADYWIEQLLQRVSEHGDWENTIVAIASDHGECLWQNELPEADRRQRPGAPARRPQPVTLLHSGHGKTLAMNLVSTPLILSGPGIPAGTRVADPVTNADLFPTLLDLCGVDVHEMVDGRSLTSTLEGRAPEEQLVYTRVLKERAVRDSDSSWRLVVPQEGWEQERAVQLYDIAADPVGHHNRAGDHPEIVARLRGLLDEVEKSHPTVTSLGRERSQVELLDMAALGYSGDDG
ncbi:MAG: sulfatase-like hydrolase/transferase [Planctomycetota bacterium]|nr:sulfatase-like hydrolase/transferase [Planctomycetota bacterium]